MARAAGLVLAVLAVVAAGNAALVLSSLLRREARVGAGLAAAAVGTVVVPVVLGVLAWHFWRRGG